MRLLISAASIVLGVSVQASTEIDLAPVGQHVRLFTIEKNENSQNVMVVYAKLDRACHFEKENGRAATGFYWLMDGRNYKPVHPLIQSNVKKHLAVATAAVPAGATDAFRVEMSDLKDIDASLDDLLLDVTAKRRGEDCVVETDLLSGKPAKKSLAVDSVYTESRKTLLPPFRKLLSLSVKGTNLVTGAKESRLIAPVKSAPTKTTTGHL